MFLFKFTNWMTNSVDPDQMASSEAIWSGSTLFAKIGVVVNSRIRVNLSFWYSGNMGGFLGYAKMSFYSLSLFPNAGWQHPVFLIFLYSTYDSNEQPADGSWGTCVPHPCNHPHRRESGNIQGHSCNYKNMHYRECIRQKGHNAYRISEKK